MDKNYRKKLERVLNEKGVDGFTWGDIEQIVFSKFAEDENVNNYLNSPYSETYMDECSASPVDITIGDFVVNIEGSFKKTMNADDQLVILRNIDAVHVTDSSGNKTNCNFQYTYGLNEL